MGQNIFWCKNQTTGKYWSNRHFNIIDILSSKCFFKGSLLMGYSLEILKMLKVDQKSSRSRHAGDRPGETDGSTGKDYREW